MTDHLLEPAQLLQPDTVDQLLRQELAYERSMMRCVHRNVWLSAVRLLACRSGMRYGMLRPIAVEHVTPEGQFRFVTYRHGRHRWTLLLAGPTYCLESHGISLEEVTDEALHALAYVDSNHTCCAGCRALTAKEADDFRSFAKPLACRRCGTFEPYFI